MILSGRDALSTVAEKEGSWNWVLVGPNPDKLPLVGGGTGAVDEMRTCLAKQEAEQKAEQQFANFYGLLRLRFGSGRMGRTKYVFVQASRVDEREESNDLPADQQSVAAHPKAGQQSAVKHGQAMAQRGAMEKALLEFVHFSAKIEVTRLSDLSVDNLVEKVQKASTADADLCTVGSYFEGLVEFMKKAKPTAAVVPEEAAKQDEKALVAACAVEIFDNNCAPAAEVHEAEKDETVADDTEHTFPMEAGAAPPQPAAAKPEPEKEAPKAAAGIADAVEAAAPSVPAPTPAPAAAATPAAAAPAPVPEYKRGDLLFVYSNAASTWMDDGIVVLVLEEAAEHDGLKLPKGSVKIQYNNRRQFKWVTPAQNKQYLRPSKRPVPPPTLLGELMKETHNWITQWHVRYFELSKGYLQWWMSSDDARSGVVPNGSLSLTGLEMSVQETVLHIRTASSKGVIYAFDATTVESSSKWSEMMKQHEAYCRSMHQYLTQQAHDLEQAMSGSKQADLEGKDKLAGLVAARKRRASINAGLTKPPQ